MKTIILCSNTSWYLWNFRKNTIRALLAKNYRVICLAPYDAHSDLISGLGAEFIAIPLEGKSTSIVNELRSLYAIFKVMRLEKPEFVFNFTIKMNLYSGLSCRLLATPYVNNVSGLGTAFLHKGLTFKFAQKLYGLSNKGAQRVFFQNEEDQAIFLAKALVNKQKAFLLPGSGIDLEHFAQAPLPEHSPFTFIMIARLIADKGVREYLAAAELVRKRNPDTSFILLGPGGVSNKSAISQVELDTWIKKGCIHYVGQQDDVRPWIEQAHVLVLPSYREGMPRTVLEAASMGRPAIVTDVPGCRQAIDAGETGWLCKAGDAQDLARVMCELVNIDEHSFKKAADAARKKMSEEFSDSIVIKAYLECLE